MKNYITADGKYTYLELHEILDTPLEDLPLRKKLRAFLYFLRTPPGVIKLRREELKNITFLSGKDIVEGSIKSPPFRVVGADNE